MNTIIVERLVQAPAATPSGLPILTIVPVVVAAAVFAFSLLQGAWQRGLSRRQFEVTVRQVQRELLDRRLKVMTVITEVLGQISMRSAISDELRTKLFSSLLEGQTVFGTTIAQKLDDVWTGLVMLHNRSEPEPRSYPVPIADRDRWIGAETARHASTDLLRIALTELRQEMINASRIETPTATPAWYKVWRF